MVRHATPLVVAPTLPSVDRLEVLIVRARLHHGPVGLAPSDESLLTVLLSFDPTEAERRAARVAAASFIAADCSFECAPLAVDTFSWLTQMLNDLPPSGLCVVIALPAHELDIERQLCALVAKVRTSHHHAPLVVGVATAPADWADCGLDGLVVAASEQRIADALRVFSMLAAVMAPGLMVCLDAEDFLCALGTATKPSRLAEGFYLEDSAGLIPASRDDRHFLSNAVGVAVMPSRCMPMKTLALLVKRVRSRLRPNAAINLVAPWGLTSDALGSARGVAVLMLCRPDAG